jgi:1,4-alpha-glucan branching enzyme
MDGKAQGYLSLLLHAHLPWVREPEHARFLEENWYYEALTETYLPLLLMLEDLIRDGVDFRLGMTITPTLLSMFRDGLLQDRYQKRIEGLIELAEKEMGRHRRGGIFLENARFYHERFSNMRRYWLETCGRDPTAGFRRLQELGRLEIVTSAATHGFLPLLRHEPAAVRAQIEVAVEEHRSAFGTRPQGFWLPECGYYPGLDEVLAEHGILYFFLDTHGVLQGSTRAHHGAYAPIVCPSGVAAFARDPECSKQVWSADHGFPGDPEYREFYRDVGFDLPLDDVAPYIAPDGVRIQTGIKYHRVTGKGMEKEPYVRGRAMQRAAEHAGVFLRWRQRQVEWLAPRMDRPPIIVAPYDAELFGHWWFEGPEWLNFLLRKCAFDQDTVLTVTPSEYLAEFPEGQESTPCLSSWGEGGYCDVWLNGRNDWIYPRLHRAAARVARAAHRHRSASGVLRRLLDQAGRELLLAQASDWPFILKSGTAEEYARSRFTENLGSFEELMDTAERVAGGAEVNEPEARRLEDLERKDTVFPGLRYETFREHLPRGPDAIVEGPRHVAFLSAEAAPYVKVGGLADVVGALPAALARLGLRVTVVLPAYRSIDRSRHAVRLLRDRLEVRLGARATSFRLLEAAPPAGGVRVLLVEEDGFFGRPGVYVDPASGEEYPDTAERFSFFVKAALTGLSALGDPVDIVHSHDHQSALAGAYLKTLLASDPVLGLAASVYTLHNLGYQGAYPSQVLGPLGFAENLSRPGGPFEHRGLVNFMKVGIHFADKVNTVSENYAREICDDPEKIGAGLGDLLRSRGADFVGILNGIDVEEWNPGRDGFLPRPYSAGDISGKQHAKRLLFQKAGLDLKHFEAPLAGMITRLVDQKGLDLVEEGFDMILATGVSLVVLGTGLPKYEKFLSLAAEKHRGRVAVELRYDNALAHLIEAGADIFLMPSLYEPCGLNQIYSLRYGTVPVVRRTGGLADTVTDDDASAGTGTGFTFDAYHPDALVDALERAVRAYRDRERWDCVVARGMRQDNSWGVSARKYLDLYTAALQARS